MADMGVMTQARELAVLERAASDAKAAFAITSPSSAVPVIDTALSLSLGSAAQWCTRESLQSVEVCVDVVQRSAAMTEAMSLNDLRQEMNSTWAEALSSTMKTASFEHESGVGVARVSAILGEAMRPLPVSPHSFAPQTLDAVRERERSAREEAVRLMAVANANSPTSPKRSIGRSSSIPPTLGSSPVPTRMGAMGSSSRSASPMSPKSPAADGATGPPRPKPMAWPKGMDDEQINNLEVSEMRKRVRLLEADLRATDAALLNRSIASMENSEITSPIGGSTTAGAKFGDSDGGKGERGDLQAALCEADRLRDQASVALAQSDSMEVQRTISEQTVDRLRQRLAEVQAEAEEDKIARLKADERADQAEAYANSLEEQLAGYTQMSEMAMDQLSPTVPNTPVPAKAPSPLDDRTGEKVLQLEDAFLTLQTKHESVRNELRETRKKWARSMSQSQIKFRAYLLLVEGMGQRRRMGLVIALTAWRQVVEEAHPDKQRTPLTHVLETAQARVQELSAENNQLKLTAMETEGLLAQLRLEHAALQVASGVSEGDQAMYTQLHQLKSQLATKDAQHTSEVGQLHEAWAAEMARADDSDKRATALGEKANKSLLEARQKSFATSAELQASFIEDRANRLQAEVELIQVTNMAQKISSEEQKKARDAVNEMKEQMATREANWKDQLRMIVQEKGTGNDAALVATLQHSLGEALAENKALSSQLDGLGPPHF